MRVLVPAAARRSHRIVVDASSTRDDLVRHLRHRPGQGRRRAAGAPRRPSAPAAPEAELRARARARRPARACSRASAKRPHKNVARLLDALAGLPPAERPVLVVPGYPTPYEADLRAPRRRARRRGRRRVAGLASRGRGPRGPLRAGDVRRLPVAARGLRPARARGDAARRPGRLLGPRRRCPRSPATRRCSSTPRTSARSARRSSGCWATAPCAADLARRGPRAGGALQLGADGRADRRELRPRAVPAARRPRRRCAATARGSGARRCSANQRAGRRAQRPAAGVDAQDRVGQVLGRGRVGRRRR